MLFGKNIPRLLPFPPLLQGDKAVLQSEESPLVIERGHHGADYVGKVFCPRPVEHVEQLQPPGGQGVGKKGVHRDMRRQVGELRSGARIRVGAHHHGDRRSFKVKEGVDTGPARGDRHGAPGLQQLKAGQLQITQPEMCGDRPHVGKGELGMQTRPLQDMKGPGELVLVNLRGPVQPEEQLDVEPRVVEDNQLRLTKARSRLKRLLVVAQKGAGQGLDLHLCRRGMFLQSGLGKAGESSEGKIGRLPPLAHPPSEIDKKRIHRRVPSAAPRRPTRAFTLGASGRRSFSAICLPRQHGPPSSGFRS